MLSTINTMREANQNSISSAILKSLELNKTNWVQQFSFTYDLRSQLHTTQLAKVIVTRWVHARWPHRWRGSFSVYNEIKVVLKNVKFYFFTDTNDNILGWITEWFWKSAQNSQFTLCFGSSSKSHAPPFPTLTQGRPTASLFCTSTTHVVCYQQFVYYCFA